MCLSLSIKLEYTYVDAYVYVPTNITKISCLLGDNMIGQK